MAPQVNWSKVKAELNKYSDLEKLKSEVHRLSQELRKFDIQEHLSPNAKERLKKVETKYHEITKSLTKTQRQVDREVSRVLRNLKSQRSKAEKGLELVKKAALDQRKKLEKASSDIAARVMNATGKKSPRKKSPRKKSPKATTTPA